jgi:hypothetical protein
MIRAFSAEVSRSWVSIQIQDHVWIVPAVQSIHILAIAALIFASFSANLAILRSPHGARAMPWLAGSYRWTWTALAILLMSGAILITGEPTRSLMNLFFRVKIVLVLLAGAMTLVLQRSLAGPGRGRLSQGILASFACLSIVAWVAIIFCGRFIAYLGNLALD